MGLGLYFETGRRPAFTSIITCKADVDKLPVPRSGRRAGRLRMNAVRTIRRELKGEVPLIGAPVARGRWRPIWWKGQQQRRLPY